jgi:hypothetical protein
MRSRDVQSLSNSMRAQGVLIPSKGIPAGLTVSLLVHSALFIMIVPWSASRQAVSPEVIPISVTIFSKPGSFGRPIADLVLEPGSEKPKSKVSSLQVEDPQTPTVSVPSSSNAWRTQYPVAGKPNHISPDQNAWRDREPSSVARSTSSRAIEESYFWQRTEAAGASGDVTNFAGGQDREVRGLTLTTRTGWQTNPVEDSKLTYSATGSPLKLTVRQASSGGFVGRAFTAGADPAFGISPMQWGDDATARSQRLDWTLLKFTNFEVTAFGYQNEVGAAFAPFAQTKNEFVIAGTQTMKAGGRVRVGSFSFGVAGSSLENAPPVTNLAVVEQGTSLTAVQQEASLTLDLAHLLRATGVSSGVLSRLLPTLSVTRSDKHSAAAGQSVATRDGISSSFGAPTIWVTGGIVPRDVVTSSFGGTWTWDDDYASLNYWSYSSDGNARLPSSGAGRGINASFGAYYSSFGIDADLSYGQTENVVRSTQSAGIVYDSSITLSYKPAKFPGLWASAETGNYRQTAIGDGTSSDLSVVSTSGEYWSFTTGVDFTRVFWGAEASAAGAPAEQRSSAKLLYRYSDSLDSSAASAVRNGDSLVAMMIQRSF